MDFFFGEKPKKKVATFLFGTWKALFFCYKSNFCVAKQSNHFLGGMKKLSHCIFFWRNFILSEPSFVPRVHLFKTPWFFQNQFQPLKGWRILEKW